MTSSVFPPYWHENVPRVAEALRRSGGTHAVEDVLCSLRVDNGALWLGSPSAFTFAQIIDYPRKRIINGALVGGDMNEVLRFEAQLCVFAVKAGCDEAVVIGRKGWERVLPGYKATGTVLRKQLGG